MALRLHPRASEICFALFAPTPPIFCHGPSLFVAVPPSSPTTKRRSLGVLRLLIPIPTIYETMAKARTGSDRVGG